MFHKIQQAVNIEKVLPIKARICSKLEKNFVAINFH